MIKNYLQNIYFTSIKNFRIYKSLFFLIVFFLGFYKSYSQSNDCATSGTAGQLTVGTSCSPVTFNSTNNTNYWNSATGCNAADYDDAWGWFDATSTTTTIQYTSTNDAILHLFTGSCATNMTHLACADANSTGTETITYTTVIGTRYLIRIQRYNSNQNMNGTICIFSPPAPTITNLLTASSGCEGSSITITGTNFTGATAANVRIGGTPVSSITSNTGTTIVAVIGTGTTGTVSVTTAGGTATSVGTFTVNPLPASIAGGAPSVCVGASTPAFTNSTAGGTWSITNGTGSATITAGGVVTGVSAGTVTVNYTLPTTCSRSMTITVNQNPAAIGGGAASVCAGASTPAFTNSVSGGTWSVTNGTGSATITAGGILTGTTAGTVTVNYTIGGCPPVTFGVTVQTTPSIPTSPVNSSITTSGFTVTWTASSGAANYTVEVFTNAGYTTHAPGSPFTVASPTVTQTVSGLNSGTIYYYRIRALNGSCASAYATGTVTTLVVSPINNQCVNATSLPCATTNLAGTTVNTLSYAHGSSCSISNFGVWYTFTGDGNSTTISATTTSFDLEMVISSGACGSLTNITCQDSALSSGTETFTFTSIVGVTYYVYIAYWGASGTSTDTGTFTISRTCTVPYNPCSSVLNIASCGTANNVTIAAGTGGYSPSSCGWTTTGIEQIYTFTPATTGNYTLTQSSAFNTINYQFKPVSTGCNNAGWTCIDDIFGTGTSPSFTLTAGIQYYILLDPQSSLGGSVNFTINCPIPPLSNDEPCNAISLSVNTTCSYSTYTNSGATATNGVTAPGCANYNGGDVWFSVIVPASGQLTVDLQAGGITDSGMAFYSGTCGTLTLLECDDDDSANGLMSNISMTGLTPGQTIFVRVWEFGNDNNGTFGICATTPSCPSPSDLLANILSTTSVTVNWNASLPPASGGYQYFINTTGVAPTSSTVPTGSTAPGVIGVTLTGLTPGQNYYFWVRSFCGGSDTSAWFGPTNYTPCAVGDGTGTTTLACPSVEAGGLGLNGGNPPTMSCQALGCVDLEATYLQLNQPTSYSVSSIPYAPPYQFTCLQNPVSVNVDDIWSPMVNLPFNFCFYGNNYNRCLIGSNGVITFDTTTYAPGGYNSWSFNSDLPNASLFRNTIFGVYQDIDPSKGGQVGWELVTLNTGCRALVTAWNDIPMFSSSCNSQLYTGMIVLYENTNVIEVYIKQKSVCATWNSGNAIVGIQNATGTSAVVPPNRNGLSADWTVTNEAWRFTPTGPSLTTLKWFEGNGTSGTQLGTSNTLNVCPAVTTTYTAEVTYALCSGTNLRYTDNVVVTVDGNKIWNGSASTDWNTNSNWTPSGVPTSSNCVIIPTTPNNPVISAAPDGVGYNLAVYNGAQLTVNSNQNLTITDRVTVQPTGIFTLNNSASLVQINNVLNSGNIIYKRESPNIRTLDYVYWSSPVAGFNVSNIVLPYSFGGIFKWNTTVPNSNGGQGAWQNAAGDTMIAGKGYIARAPGTSPFNNTTFNVLRGSFTGVPHNGNITIPIERGIDQNLAPHFGINGTQITNLSDNWNLLGNPYPSAIRASQFLFDNNTKIEGNVRLWTHGTLPSVITPSPFYGSYLSNYTPGDYLTYNFTGTSCCPTAASDLFIGAGQGFFVQMIDGPAVAASDNVTVLFNNNLRSASYSNSTFYRAQNTTTSTSVNVDSIERNRIWLDFITPNNQTDRILFGYIENATMGKDSFYDCITQNSGAPIIYSLVDDTKFSIQGRALPFNINDEVPLGYNATISGNYTIGITAVDGLFNNQNIYLKDNVLNIIHDLKASPYQFSTQPGENNSRFKIVYVDNSLGNPTNTYDNTIKVMVNNEVAVSSNNLEMDSIIVYNVLGQKIERYTNINSNFTTLSNLRKNNTTLLLKIKLQNGETITKKIIF